MASDNESSGGFNVLKVLLWLIVAIVFIYLAIQFFGWLTGVLTVAVDRAASRASQALGPWLQLAATVIGYARDLAQAGLITFAAYYMLRLAWLNFRMQLWRNIKRWGCIEFGQMLLAFAFILWSAGWEWTAFVVLLQLAVLVLGLSWPGVKAIFKQ